jgi:hypothetical protein
MLAHAAALGAILWATCSFNLLQVLASCRQTRRDLHPGVDCLLQARFETPEIALYCGDSHKRVGKDGL